MDSTVLRKSNGTTDHAETLSPEEYALGRPGWFIFVRFITVAGVTVLLAASQFLFHIPRINYTWLWALAFALLGTNLIYLSFHRSGLMNLAPHLPGSARRFTAFFGVQFAVDVVILTLLLHFSGGIENPFFLYYFFPIVLASILLKKRESLLATGTAVTLFSTVVLLENTGVIRHYHLFSHPSPLSVAGFLAAFGSATLITAYLTATVTEHLRKYRSHALQTTAEKSTIEMEKAHFLDVVALDLKSPLAAIESSVLSLLTIHGSEMSGEVRGMIEQIPKRMRDLIRFIQNLLDFSKIRGSGELEARFKPLNFLFIVTSTVEMYRDQAMDKGITLDVHAEQGIPRVKGSVEHLERLAGNLLSNAIRYTPPNGSVKVNVCAENGDVVLTVADSGIGIPEKDMPRIFEEFFRAPNARAQSDAGAGLGLSIARYIAEKHGGSILANSVEGEGTVFTVRLPALPAE